MSNILAFIVTVLVMTPIDFYDSWARLWGGGTTPSGRLVHLMVILVVAFILIAALWPNLGSVLVGMLVASLLDIVIYLIILNSRKV